KGAGGGKQMEFATGDGKLTATVAQFHSEDTGEGQFERGPVSIGSKPVGRFPPNPWGFYDMAGNVWEWTGSAARPYPYVADDGREKPTKEEPVGIRGGSWFTISDYLHKSHRTSCHPEACADDVGFRCVLTEKAR